MKKTEIIREIKTRYNLDKDKNKKLNLSEVEEIIESFKAIALECSKKGENFDYVGFINIETNTIEEQESVNPKTQKPCIVEERLRSKVKLSWGFKQKIKQVKISK